MPPLPNYLYKYPQSNSYYFRIRIPVAICQKFYLQPFVFVASLRCNNLYQSRTLALFIRAKFAKEWTLFMETQLADFKSIIQENVNQSFEPENWDFRAYLKSRFALYLSMSKDAIRTEVKTHLEPENIPIPSQADTKLYEQHLKDTIETGESGTTFEQLAHKQYLLSYLNDYGAFLTAEHYPDIRKSETEALETPLNLNTAAESHFKEYAHGEEMLDMMNVQRNQPMDKYAINRFIAKHGWQEFLFKKQLLTNISEYAQDYNHFIDDDYEPKNWSLAQWQAYEDIFETFKETLKLIKSLKRNAITNKKEKTSIKLKETFELFLAEKSKSVKKDTVDHYQISFNFFMDLLGADYDLRDLDKKEAKRIKDAIIAKSANSEKGCNDKTLAVATINRYMINLGAFTNWCNDNNYDVQRDLFTNLKLKETKNSKARRRPYTQDEIELIKAYDFKDKREAKEFREDAFWFPKIALYTGMRLNEISFLTTDDFGIENGIQFISLHDKDLKTETSERRFPIHSKLIEFGLLELVEKRKKQKEKVLFIDCRKGKKKPGKYGYGEKISRWYNRTFLGRIGIDKNIESEQGFMIDFHCLRTTFISLCKQKGLNGYIVKQIVGHLGDDDITFDTYGSQVSTKMEAMKNLIEEINY